MTYQTGSNVYTYSRWIVDATNYSPFTTVQAAINNCNAHGGGTVVIRPGTYVENLTLYNNVNLEGATSAEVSGIVTITGTHTPPAAGNISIKSLRLLTPVGSTFNSAAAGTTNIYLEDVSVGVTNGFLFNLVNWRGGIFCYGCSSGYSTEDGFINNTGGSVVEVYNSIFGAGSTQTMIVRGDIRLIDVEGYCPINFQTGTVLTCEGSVFNDAITFSNNSSGQFYNSVFITGAASAITQSSTGAIVLSDCTIDSSNASVIAGAGAGAVTLGSVTYLTNTGIAGTVTKDFTTRHETGVLKINDADNGILIATNGVVSTGGGTLNQQQIYYVGKHGNNANNGLSIGNAVLTFTQALTLAAAAGPTAANRFAIVCFDDGIYTENITCVQYVDIFAPDAKLTGTITAADDCEVKFRAQSVATGTTGVAKFGGAGTFYVEIDEITCAGTGDWVVSTSGIVLAKWKKCTIVDGHCIGDLTSALGHIHVFGGDIYITGTGVGIARANAGSTVGQVDHIIDQGAGNGVGVSVNTGELDLYIGQTSALANSIYVSGGTANISINSISSTSAYDISGGALNLFYNVLSGSRNQSGGTLKLWRPPTVMTNGQVVIGSTGNDPVTANITPGTGIAVTNGAGSITIGTAGGGLAWSTQSASTALVVNNGFIAIAPGGALSFSLPATSAVGDVVALTLDDATSWVITQGANQRIRLGNTQTTLGAGGTLTSTAAGDTVMMVCRTANLIWQCYTVIGNITVV